MDAMFIQNLSSKLQRKMVRRILAIEQNLLKKNNKHLSLKIILFITKDSVTVRVPERSSLLFFAALVPTAGLQENRASKQVLLPSHS